MLPSEILSIIFTSLKYKYIIRCSNVSRLFRKHIFNNYFWYLLIIRNYSTEFGHCYHDITYHDNYKYHNMYRFLLSPYMSIYTVADLDSICKITKFKVSEHLSDSTKISLSQFTELTHVDLSYSLYQCKVENFCFNDMKNLKSINISRNFLYHVPPLICTLISLEEIDLSNNMLSELPESFSCLRLITKINMSKNSFSTVPACVYTLPCVTLVDMRNNVLIIPPITKNILF